MALRGKDFCNCEHAQMLRDAIETAAALIQPTVKLDPARLGPIQDALEQALHDDHTACIELWGDMKEGSK